MDLSEKVVSSHIIDCYGGAKALLVVFENGSVDVDCRNYHNAGKCSGIKDCPYKKY